MTLHPAIRPAVYRPFTDPATLVAELDDIDMMTRAIWDGGVPLRDRVATLVADWQDTTVGLGNIAYPVEIDVRQELRRGEA